MYVEPMLAYAEALKSANPDVTFIAGWGLRPSEDNWACFRLLLKPTLDAGIKYIDGVHEHDYGGDPTKVCANYEVLTAYGMTEHEKWLTGWNTEQGAQTDPQAYPEAAGDLNRAGFDALVKQRWTTRKLLSALATIPGKARAFAHFGDWWNPNGQGTTLLLLRNLRGKLVNVETGMPEIYAVAAIDGTDPQNPRPKDMPQRKELVVAVLNDAVTPVPVKLSVAAPKGMQFAGSVIRREVVFKEGKPTVGATDSQFDSPNLRTFDERITLGPRQVVTFTLPLNGDEPDKPQVVRKQFFADVILRQVTPQNPVSAKLKVDADARKTARRAWVRYAAEKLDRSEATLTINGEQIGLRPAITPENTPWLRVMEIDPKLLEETNTLKVTVDDKHAGFLLGSLSVMVESE